MNIDSQVVSSINPFAFSACCILGYMCLLFIIAQLKKDNGVVDIGWGTGFILVAFATFYLYGSNRLHQKLVTFIVMIWGLRLSLYIFIRNWDRPEDFRYAKWREEWGRHVVVRSFFQIFMLQGIIMFINTLPIVVVNSSPLINKSLIFLYPTGSILGLIGFLFEAIGDWQMYSFKSNPHQHQHAIMNKGLWRYSRHPNYFGEAVQWWAMFLLAIPSGKWYLSILAPVTITFLLIRVSGITLLEKKYEGNDAYSLYKRTTSAFLPWIPKQET
jgi:steroid 5-alpha reductase family enzyme